jgi:hypothetical protein
MDSFAPAAPAFSEGDEVLLAGGTYLGTPGLFLRLREDPKWADIAESNGRIRCHPVEWLAHAPGAIGLAGTKIPI